MWGSNITRDQLLQKISLLATLGPIGDGPRRHNLTAQTDIRRSLTVEQEAEIVDNLAFLSYRRKDSQNVTAICMEENEDGEGMLVRLAVNGGALSQIACGVREICMILEQIARRNNPESSEVETFFREIVKLDFSRISSRLRLAKKYRFNASQIVKLHEALREELPSGIEPSEMVTLRQELDSLLDLYRTLKGSPISQRDPTTREDVGQIIMIVHELNRSPGLHTALNQSTRLSELERDAMKDWLAKVGQYYGASRKLVLAARRPKCKLFQRIRVETFQFEVPNEVRLPSRPGSALALMQSLRKLDVSNLHTFKGSESEAENTLLKRLDGTRSGIKVHAEIKLLFYYETHPQKTRPRVICANKSACYLCDLFFRVHGQFQVLRTFGKLKERWILPDWLDTIPEDRLPALRTIIERFDNVLDMEIIRVLRSRSHERRRDPIESAICLSAHWSSSNLGNLPISRPLHREHSVGSIGAGSGGVLRSSAVLRSAGETPVSGSYASIVIAERSLSYSMPTEFEILQPGTTVRKRLANNDRSFLLSLDESSVVLSFNGHDNSGDVHGQSLWVRVCLLEPSEQTDVDTGGRDIIPLGALQGGSEVTVEYDEEKFRQILYLSWRSAMISIGYSETA